MTVEERAKQAIEQSALPPGFSQWWAVAISPEQTEALIQSIAQSLRDQIEDCAKVVEEGNKRPDEPLVTDHRFTLKGSPGGGLCRCGMSKWAHDGRRWMTRKQLLKAIRTLAGQTEQTEGKG